MSKIYAKTNNKLSKKKVLAYNIYLNNKIDVSSNFDWPPYKW